MQIVMVDLIILALGLLVSGVVSFIKWRAARSKGVELVASRGQLISAVVGFGIYLGLLGVVAVNIVRIIWNVFA